MNTCIKITQITSLALCITFTSCKEVATETKDSDTATTEVVTLRVVTPQPSPLSTLEQKVGLTDVTVEYSRPSIKGRTIFGDLVPFGEIWRTGANANTKVTFSSDVTVEGQALKAGSYALYTIPNKDSWEVIFYTDSNNSGTPRAWDDSKVAAKAAIKPEAMPMSIETFTITVDDITINSAIIGLLWEETYVGIQFETPTDAMVLANIDKVLAASPKAADYYNAAVYYSQNNKDINKAGAWMDTAMSMIEKPGFWQLRQQSLIYAKMGDTEKAIATAKASLKGAMEANNTAYIKMNTESLKEWAAK